MSYRYMAKRFSKSFSKMRSKSQIKRLTCAPPCIEFSPSFLASLYSVPSTVNFPPAIRFPTRPMTHPKYGLGLSRFNLAN